MGVAFRKLGNFSRAIDCFVKTIEISPDDGSAAFEIGESYFSMGDYTSADEWFNGAVIRYQKGIDANSEDDKLYSGLGNAYKRLKRDKEATKSYDKALYLNPENSEARSGLNELKSSAQKELHKPTTKSTSAVCEDNIKSFFSDSAEVTDSEKKKKASNEETLSQIFAELDEFVGLNSVKKEIMTLVNFIGVQNSRADLGLKTSPVSYHIVFTGNPGTGKTTIAKILGKIYKSLGILGNGQLYEVDRSFLVGERSGHSTEKVNKIVNDSEGGILFIEDAASLSESKNDFTKETISALVKKIDSTKNKLVVILAGRAVEMSNFLEINTTLATRFTRYIEFPDYTPDEMLKIFEKKCLELEYDLSEKAVEKLGDLFKNVYATRDRSFGNAVFVHNVFEKTIERQANRIVTFSKLTKELLTVIEADDIPGTGN
jgi:tetratricopeptide (TPR) repeat protein